MASIALARVPLKTGQAHAGNDHAGQARPATPVWRRWLMVVLFVAMALLATSLQAKSVVKTAAETDTITYTMKRGDTLIGIADRHFTRPADYKQVQSLNAIRNPYAIATGKVIRIPRNLLKYRAIAITIASARGPVTMNTAPARSGLSVVEGATLRTGAQGFASLSFDNASRVSLPSNSTLIVRRARVYQIDNSRDVELELVSGGMRSKVSPFTAANDRDRVRTRHSVTAVRGTEFGTSLIDSKNGSDAVISEVYEGSVALGPGDSVPLVTAGNGVKLAADGARIEAALLPAPDLANAGAVQSGEQLRFALSRDADGATGYRFELASDATFIDQLSDDRSTQSSIALPALPDGRYYLRLSAIDTNGFVGKPVTYAFRRVRSGATASAAVDADGYLFKWQTIGARRPDVRFRLTREGDSVPLLDEPDLKGSELRLSDLPPGRYVWQIGTLLVDEGDIIENWTAPETLIVSR